MTLHVCYWTHSPSLSHKQGFSEDSQTQPSHARDLGPLHNPRYGYTLWKRNPPRPHPLSNSHTTNLHPTLHHIPQKSHTLLSRTPITFTNRRPHHRRQPPTPMANHNKRNLPNTPTPKHSHQQLHQRSPRTNPLHSSNHHHDQDERPTPLLPKQQNKPAPHHTHLHSAPTHLPCLPTERTNPPPPTPLILPNTI